eukprot:4717384-Heterocapsa_arctica.AAC.1
MDSRQPVQNLGEHVVQEGRAAAALTRPPGVMKEERQEEYKEEYTQFQERCRRTSRSWSEDE